MDILLRKDLNREEYILVHSLQIFGMKKVPADKITKIMTSEETR